MSRTLAARIAGAVLATGAAGAIALAGAGAADAQSYSSTPLSPGQGACSASQYASYQVRGDGWATVGPHPDPARRRDGIGGGLRRGRPHPGSADAVAHHG